MNKAIAQAVVDAYNANPKNLIKAKVIGPDEEGYAVSVKDESTEKAMVEVSASVAELLDEKIEPAIREAAVGETIRVDIAVEVTKGE